MPLVYSSCKFSMETSLSEFNKKYKLRNSGLQYETFKREASPVVSYKCETKSPQAGEYTILPRY